MSALSWDGEAREVKARFARLDDDLTGLWPEMAYGTWNRDQMLVAESDDGSLAGGLLFIDGGHAVFYVESIRVAPRETRRFYVVKPLLQAVFDYAREHGKLIACWPVPEGEFADLLMRSGCEDQGPHRYLLRRVHDALPWER